MAGPTPLPPAEEPAFITDDGDFALFFARHRATILGAIAAIFIIGVAIGWWFVSSHQARLASEALLARASGLEQWREVVEKYPGSSAAGDALLLTAKAQRDEGKLPESSETYSQFLAGYPKHPMIGAARLGLAENLEVLNKTPEAIEALRLVYMEDASSYAAPFAMLQEGRILLRQSKVPEARRVLADLTAKYAGSPCAQIATAELERLTEVTGDDLPPVSSPAAVAP